jgi:hypothetical protein
VRTSNPTECWLYHLVIKITLFCLQKWQSMISCFYQELFVSSVSSCVLKIACNSMVSATWCTLGCFKLSKNECYKYLCFISVAFKMKITILSWI